jgi:1-acyl-sn-glycerol-3-phosphate acyltransferase
VEPVYLAVVAILRPLLAMMFRWKFIGMENVPRKGPAVVAGNHISYFDPLCQGYFVVKARRRPRFFAKMELWRNPFLHFILKHARQIQVNRGTGETGPVEKACEVIGHGEVVMIYPESTISTNADLTPMRGKTGVARVAITTGAPVIPIAVWGSQWVKPKRRKAVHKFRRLIMVKAGPPLSFAHLSGKENDAETLRDVTDQIMAELDRLVRELHKVYPDGAAVPELKEDPG